MKTKRKRKSKVEIEILPLGNLVIEGSLVLESPSGEKVELDLATGKVKKKRRVKS